MLKIFISQIIPNLPLTEILRPNLGGSKNERWTERYVQLKERLVEIVPSPDLAEFIVLPHNYNLVKGNKTYLDSYESIANNSHKKILVFSPGDSAEPVDLRNALVFRNSAYRTKKRQNEIILPGYVEDLGLAGLNMRPKSEKAKIGFCGWAGMPNFKQEIKFKLKSLPISLRSISNPNAILLQKGIWWRKKAIRILENSNQVRTDFILRNSYSGNEKTIELDPVRAKKEYVENILNNDFTLCVKGDGNFSTRFYETLSLGRIPLLVDTECVLPLEDKIDYSKLILRVDWKDLSKIDEIVAAFYSALSNEDFLVMQRNSREIFEKYLRLDSYFNLVLNSGYLYNL